MSASRDKGHREFTQLPVDDSENDAWKAVPGHVPGITQLVLGDNLDPESRTGSRSRLIRWAAGTLLTEPVQHDYREEVLVLEGDLVVGCDPHDFHEARICDPAGRCAARPVHDAPRLPDARAGPVRLAHRNQEARPVGSGFLASR